MFIKNLTNFIFYCTTFLSRHSECKYFIWADFTKEDGKKLEKNCINFSEQASQMAWVTQGQHFFWIAKIMKTKVKKHMDCWNTNRRDLQENVFPFSKQNVMNFSKLIPWLQKFFPWKFEKNWNFQKLLYEKTFFN